MSNVWPVPSKKGYPKIYWLIRYEEVLVLLIYLQNPFLGIHIGQGY